MKILKASIRGLLLALLALTALPAVQANDWDEQPSVKKSVAPDNPNKLDGMVTATIVIDEQGFVTDASINKSTDSSLEGPVLDAVKQWRFNPAKKGGSAVSCKINVPFKFKG